VPQRSYGPANGRSIGSVVFVRPTVVTDRQTDTESATDQATPVVRGRVFALRACDAA